ncbi:hypothetical protein FLAV_01942 [Flavobacteriales bacterium]|nr:hypothetical protein FLAV_01942 [Flavobacteriales bacterium]
MTWDTFYVYFCLYLTIFAVTANKITNVIMYSDLKDIDKKLAGSSTKLSRGSRKTMPRIWQRQAGGISERIYNERIYDSLLTL